MLMQAKFIPALAVACFLGVTSSAEQITLVNGDRIVAPVLEENDSFVVVDHPVFGHLQIPREQIVVIMTDVTEDTGGTVIDSQEVYVEDVEASDAPPPPEEVAADEERKKLWEARLEITFSAVEGNSNTQDFRGAFAAKRETDATIFKFDAVYYVAASNGDRTDNAASVGVENEWLIPDSKWSYFVYARWTYDEFQSWDYRITGGGGLKYHLVEKENYDLKLLGGIGFIKEFGSNNDDIQPEALFGVEGEWRIAEKQKLTYFATIFPNLSETGEFRTVSGLHWTHELNDSLDFILGLYHEYQSQVDPGFDKNDLRIYGGLGVNF